MDKNVIQDMHCILGSINPVVDNLLPPKQIHHHVTPELESNDPYSPTLETPLKPSIPEATHKRGWPATDSIEGGPTNVKRV